MNTSIMNIPEGISSHEVEMMYTLYSTVQSLLIPSKTIFVYKYILNM